MSRLNPDKLTVEFRNGVTPVNPIIPRCYTLTHSDITADLFLTIGANYAYDQINRSRDEVLGKWMKEDSRYRYYVYLQVDGLDGRQEIRNYVFRKELPLALEAIHYGDRAFFSEHPGLNLVPILVFFLSKDPRYRKVEDWGRFSDY